MTIASKNAGKIVQIQKLDARGHLVAAYPGWLLQNDEPILVLARWQSPDHPTPYTTFAHGDLMVEAYFHHRPFNIFALFDGRQLPDQSDLQKLATTVTNPERCLHTSQPICAPLQRQCPLKGHYVNFTASITFSEASQTLIWRDLALDLWAPAQGDPIVLDEEAYRALRLPETQPELAAQIDQTLAELLAQAKSHTGFFKQLQTRVTPGDLE
ncbi:MAG: hypothetical protein DSY55_05430 [Clostridia bacterium]|nr:MAG: hypothetical protein DSY55_05430 [Clostridia bacterium]